jgi:hypothetical protein
MRKLLDSIISAGAKGSEKLPDPRAYHALELVVSGTFASLEVALQGSVSGNVWATLASHTFVEADFTAGGVVIEAVNKPVEMVRCNVRIYNSGTAATATLTSTGNAASGDTITLDTKTYTFKTTYKEIEGLVVVGGSAATSLQNLKYAVNLGVGSGTTYFAAAAHPTASAATADATTISFVAKEAGDAGNDIATTKVAANLAFGGLHMTGGVNYGVVDGYYMPY